MTNYTQILPNPVERRGFGFISQRDKNRRHFRRGDMHSSSRRSRLSSHTYNLRSPINIQPPPGQGRVLSRRSLGSSVPAPIALHLRAGTRLTDLLVLQRSASPVDDKPPTVPTPPHHRSTRSLPVARRLDYCCKKGI